MKNEEVTTLNIEIILFLLLNLLYKILEKKLSAFKFLSAIGVDIKLKYKMLFTFNFFEGMT